MKFKHIFTTICPRRCDYCITRNLKVPRRCDLDAVEHTYAALASKGFDEIMITGGEPTAAWHWVTISQMAGVFFERVHLTTANHLALRQSSLFDSVTLSLHGRPAPPVGVGISCPVYAAVMAREYNPRLPAKLEGLGYSGLLIAEDQRGEDGFTLQHSHVVVSPGVSQDFTFKLNTRGVCMDVQILMPDLVLFPSFRDFL